MAAIATKLPITGDTVAQHHYKSIRLLVHTYPKGPKDPIIRYLGFG